MRTQSPASFVCFAVYLALISHHHMADSPAKLAELALESGLHEETIRFLCASEVSDSDEDDIATMVWRCVRDRLDGARCCRGALLTSIEEGRGTPALLRNELCSRLEQDIKQCCLRLVQLIEPRATLCRGAKKDDHARRRIPYLQMLADLHRYVADVTLGDERDEAVRHADSQYATAATLSYRARCL
jgi:hypothetical protein